MPGRTYPADTLGEGLDGDSVGSLLDASMHFVTHEDDHASSWLGTERYDKRGWAGYLALALLERHGRLHDVPDASWASWVGALVWFPAMHGDVTERDRKKDLLSRAAAHAVEPLIDAIVTYLRGQISGGRLTSEVELVAPAWDRRLADAWVAILDELADAIIRLEPGTAADNEDHRNDDHGEPDTEAAGSHPDEGTIIIARTADAQDHVLGLWETMLIALFDADERASAMAQGRLQQAAESEAKRHLAIRAAKALLHVDAHRYWPEILSVVEQDSGPGQRCGPRLRNEPGRKTVLRKRRRGTARTGVPVALGPVSPRGRRVSGGLLQHGARGRGTRVA
jgi:hypothetical protein